MIGLMLLSMPHSMNSMLSGFLMVRIVIRFLAWGLSMSPTPSAPRFVVAKIRESGCTLRPAIFHSCMSASNPFCTAGLALPYSSIISRMGWFSRCSPSSSCVAKRT